MGQRSRKRGQRAKPPEPLAAKTAVAAKTAETGKRTGGTAPTPVPAPAAKPLSRSEKRNAAVRATLTPLAPGERPWPLIAGAALAAAVGLANLIAYFAGVKIGGKRPAAGGIVIFSLLMLVCAVGVWRRWYGAVLALMALLGIVVTLFFLFMIEASNVLGIVVPLAIIAVCGYLFYKLVRVLSRIQMPKYPGR